MAHYFLPRRFLNHGFCGTQSHTKTWSTINYHLNQITFSPGSLGATVFTIPAAMPQLVLSATVNVLPRKPWNHCF